MDVFFTISVWVVLVGLVTHGLRLTQRAHDEVVAAQFAATTAPPAPVPAPARGERGRSPELVGAGAGQDAASR